MPFEDTPESELYSGLTASNVWRVLMAHISDQAIEQNKVLALGNFESDRMNHARGYLAALREFVAFVYEHAGEDPPGPARRNLLL